MVPQSSCPALFACEVTMPLLTPLSISLGSLRSQMASAAHSKTAVGGWLPSAPKAPAKHSGRGLPSPGSAQWDPLHKWQSIECHGGSLRVNWRNSLVNMIITGSSKDIWLWLLTSMCTQVGSLSGSDLERAVGWCWCGSAHVGRWISQQKDFFVFLGSLQPCYTVLALMPTCFY